jgi:hypothetical protein
LMIYAMPWPASTKPSYSQLLAITKSPHSFLAFI